MNDRPVSRRDFMKTVGVVGVGSLMDGPVSWRKLPRPRPRRRSRGTRNCRRGCWARRGEGFLLALGGIFDIASNQLQLKQALDLGVTYWDTASGYNGGNSETGIGMYFEKNPQVRKSVFLVTKASGAHSVDDLSQSLEQSLGRMKTDFVDTFSCTGSAAPKP